MKLFKHGGKRVPLTHRSMKLLRQEGFTVGVVERNLNVPGRPFTKFDLFGFADLIAIREEPPNCMLIQTTSRANIRDREHKVQENGAAVVWLSFPSHTIEIHGWVKRKRGGLVRWECERSLAYLHDGKVEYAYDARPRIDVKGNVELPFGWLSRVRQRKSLKIDPRAK